MHSRTTPYTLKKLVLALALAGCTMGSAWAVLTPSTGTIQGTVPVLKSSAAGQDGSVALSWTSATGGSALATGDTIEMSYVYDDAEGDEELNATLATWYYVPAGGGAEVDITSAATHVPATTPGSTGTSTLTIPAAAVGSTIKVVMRQVSATGVPTENTPITIQNVSVNPDGETDVPGGPVIPGGNMTPGIYLSTDTAFANNLIGDTSTNLNVGDTYVFKLWDSSDVGGTDLSSSVTYNWRLMGTSATTGTSAGSDGIDTGVSDGNYTIGVNSAYTSITQSADGAQGFSLAVDYE